MATKTRTRNVKDIASSGKVTIHMPDGKSQEFNTPEEAQDFFDTNFGNSKYSLTPFSQTRGDGSSVFIDDEGLEHPMLPEIVVTNEPKQEPVLDTTPSRRGFDLWTGANYSPRYNAASNKLGMNPIEWAKQIPASYWDSQTHLNVLWGNNVAASVPIIATAPAWMPYLSAGTLLPELAEMGGAGANALAGWTAAGEAIDGGLILLGGYDGSKRIGNTVSNAWQNGTWTWGDTGNMALGAFEVLPFASKVFPSANTRLTVGLVWDHAVLLGKDIKQSGWSRRNPASLYNASDRDYGPASAFLSDPESFAVTPTLLNQDAHRVAGWVGREISPTWGTRLDNWITRNSRSDQLQQMLQYRPQLQQVSDLRLQANTLSDKANNIWDKTSYTPAWEPYPDQFRTINPIDFSKASPLDIAKYYRKHVRSTDPIPFTVLEDGQLLYQGQYPMDPYRPFSIPQEGGISMRIPIYGTDQYAEGVMAGGGGMFHTLDGDEVTLMTRRFLPDPIRQAIDHNLSYVEQRLPGARPFGSSVISSRTGWAKLPNDIDVYMTEADMGRLDQSLLRQRVAGQDETYIYDLGRASGRDYTVGTSSDEWNGIDVNVLRPKGKGTMPNDRAIELWQQYYPEEYTAWRIAHPDAKINVIPHTPDEMIALIDPSKSVMDMLQIKFGSSAKDKHMGRLYDMVINSDNSEEMSGLLRQALLRERGQLPPRYAFDNPTENALFLEEIGFPQHLRAQIQDDPNRMLAVADLWFADNTTHMRGISRYRTNLLEAFTKPSVNWGGGVVNGHGLNTVLNGDSGHSGWKALVQPFVPEEGIQTPLEMVNTVRKYEGHLPFTEEQQAILLRYGLKATTPLELANETYNLWPNDAEHAKEMALLGQELGINAYSNGYEYGNGIYSSLIRDFQPGEYSITMPPLEGRQSFANRLSALQGNRDPQVSFSPWGYSTSDAGQPYGWRHVYNRTNLKARDLRQLASDIENPVRNAVYDLENRMNKLRWRNDRWLDYGKTAGIATGVVGGVTGGIMGLSSALGTPYYVRDLRIRYGSDYLDNLDDDALEELWEKDLTEFLQTKNMTLSQYWETEGEEMELLDRDFRAWMRHKKYEERKTNK